MTKLCPRGKSAAKRKFKVYPSAYANAYASKICAGKIKDPSGTKRKDFRGPKPSGAKVGMAVTAGSQSGVGRLQKSGLMKAKEGKAISRREREMQLRKKQNPHSQYDRKGKLKYTAAKEGVFGEPYSTNTQKDIPRTKPKGRGSKNKSIPTYRAKEKGIIRNANTYDQGGSIKINKVVKGLKKASKTHAAQAKTLQSIKLSRGGGAAIKGMNFKGVY